MNRQILLGAGRVPIEPGGQLAQLDQALERAELEGDEPAVADLNARIDEMFAAARERAGEARRATTASFSAGPRQPVRKRSSPS